jgi:hypothetical protein
MRKGLSSGSSKRVYKTHKVCFLFGLSPGLLAFRPWRNILLSLGLWSLGWTCSLNIWQLLRRVTLQIPIPYKFIN